jgi:predicted porin
MWKALAPAELLVVVGLFACGCDQAQAQSKTGVRTYGRVVAGVNYLSNLDTGRVSGNGNAISGSQWSVNGNVWGTSMLGIAGVEDLGNGLYAQFVLESGFEAAKGVTTGGPGIWTRRATVGLGGSFGSLKLGRSLSLPTETMWALDPSGQQAVGTASLVKGRSWTTNSNQIDYTTPSIGGFTAQGVYGFGEAANSTRKGRTGGVLLAYTQPNYELRAMYDVANDSAGQYSSLFQYSKEWTFGATVSVDKLKLFAGYQRLLAPAVVSGPDKATHFWVGANYQILPALTLIGAAYHVNLNKATGRANLLMLGANYSLSQRTLLYVSIGTVRNAAQTDFAVETYNGVMGKNQSAFYTGISQSF